MADQSIKLKIGADVSDLERSFDNAIKKIQADINKIKSPANILQAQQATAAKATSMGYPMSGPNADAINRANSLAQAQMRQKTLEEQRGFEMINRILEKRKAIVDDLRKAQENVSKGTKEEMVIKEQLFRAEQRERDAKLNFAQRNATFNAMLDAQQKAAGGGVSSASSVAMMAKYGAAGLGLLGEAANYMGSRPIQIAGMQASAISMTTGRQLGEARSGEYTYEGMYGRDRQKAQDTAASSNRWKTAGDVAIAAGAAAALVGSAFATGGASLLLGGAGLVGLKSSLMDKGMADPAKYAAFRQQREATDFTTMLAAEHENSPFRKDAIERYKATGMRDLGMQRTLGLRDSDWKTRGGAPMGGYYGAGGYLKGQTDLGFTDEMVTKASQSVLGAGGSTAMALQSGTALQAERGLGLTNSPQLLGQLSGTQGIPETSKKTLIDIFARGFDSSRYAEENRRYMEAVTEQANKGGTTSEDSIGRIADMIRSTVSGTPTTRGIEAGKTAFEAYQNAATSTSGYLGGINISSAMQDKNLSRIKDPAELQALLKLKPNEIDENDPDFVKSAQSIGLTGPQLAEKLRTRQINNMRTAVGGRSGMAERGMIGTLIPGMGNAEQKAFANLLNQPESPERNAQIEKMRTDAEAKMTSKETGRAGDTAVQASAKNAQISLETLAASIDKFATDAMNAAKKLAGEATTGRAHEAAVSAAQAISDAATGKMRWNSKTHMNEFMSDIADRNLSKVQNQAN